MDTSKAFEGIDRSDAARMWEEAQRVLYYDDYSGWFYERNSKPRKCLMSYAKSGKAYVAIGDLKMSAAKMVWLWHHKQWPESYVYHKNGLPTDNRIENLQDGPFKAKKEGYAEKVQLGFKSAWQAYGADGKPIGIYRTKGLARVPIADYDKAYYAGQELF